MISTLITILILSIISAPILIPRISRRFRRHPPAPIIIPRRRAF